MIDWHALRDVKAATQRASERQIEFGKRDAVMAQLGAQWDGQHGTPNLACKLAGHRAVAADANGRPIDRALKAQRSQKSPSARWNPAPREALQ